MPTSFSIAAMVTVAAHWVATGQHSSGGEGPDEDPWLPDPPEECEDAWEVVRAESNGSDIDCDCDRKSSRKSKKSGKSGGKSGRGSGKSGRGS